MVPSERFELPTRYLQGSRSGQLSYDGEIGGEQARHPDVPDGRVRM